MKRWVTYGFYSLVAQLWNVNIEHVIEDLKSSNFSGLSVHLLSPWGQHPDTPWFPWQWDGSKFLMAKKNLAWYAKLDEFVRAMLQNKMDLEIGFFDQYLDDKPPHPLDGKLSVKELYDSWVGGNNFAWLKWDDLGGIAVGNFRAVDPWGKSLMKYVTSVMDIVSEAMKDIPTGRIAWKRANETRAYYINGHSDSVKSVGDRHEIFKWMQQEWKDRGMDESPRFRSYNDFGCIVGGSPSNPDGEYKTCMMGGYNGTIGGPMRASRFEIHGLGKIVVPGGTAVKDWRWYQNAGLNLNKCLLSTDGLQVKDGFDKWTRDLYDSPANAIDLKMEEASVPFKWTDKDMMRNWNKAFDSHAKRIS